ncbi:MAG: WXG100 family type VII secretion target [Oscillospiraceae bacterium]
MAEGIKVSTEVLNLTATKLSNINDELDGRLSDINKSMNDLDATWKSDAGSDIRANMNKLKPVFQQYKQVIESYSQFLKETAQKYETTEGKLIQIN